MEVRRVFESKSDDASALPAPNAELRFGNDDGPFTEEQVRGIICNPIYAGIGPYPGIIDDRSWIKSASKAIDEVGNEQFLINLLHLLRESLQHTKID